MEALIHLFDEASLNEIQKSSAELERRRVVPPSVVFDARTTPIKFSCLQDSDGFRKLDYFLDLINRMPMKPNQHQLKAAQNTAQAFAQGVFGVDFEALKDSICQRYGWKSINKATIMVAPRRFGKSVSIAQQIAAAILSRCKRNLAVFSTGERASNVVRKYTLNFLKHFDKEFGIKTGKRLRTRKEEVIFNHPNGSESLAAFYPSNEKISVKCFF